MSRRYTRQDQKISARVGEEFVITLDANPTTGYLWQPPAEHDLLRFVDRRFTPSGSAIGSGGGEELRFRCVAAGSAPMTLKYQRPWEDVAAEQFTLTLEVR